MLDGWGEGGYMYSAIGLEEVLCYADPFLTSRGEANSNGVFGHMFTDSLNRRKREDGFVFSLGVLVTLGTHLS